MNESIMREGHLQATLARASTNLGDYLIAAQDTTFYKYTTHQAMQGPGKIQGHITGIMQHNILLMSELGQPLGLVDQQYWSRQGSHPFQGKRD